MKRIILLFFISAIYCIAAKAQPITANFSGTPTTVCTGDTVFFTDLSTGSPTGWNWTFQGGTPATSNVQNPFVIYNTVGVYDVTLNITKGFQFDSEFKNNYITVVATPAQPGNITGSNAVCPGQSGVTYSIAAVTGATSYTWTVPAGATITSGQGTTSITVTFGNTPGNVCVTADNLCGSSTPRCLAVTISSTLAPPDSITGLNAVCANQIGLPYSITAVPGATSYLWTVPSGVTILSGQGTTSIVVNWGTNSGNVCVSAMNSCDTSAATCLNVSVVSGPPATPGAISGPDTVCENEAGVTYSIALVADASGYSWNVPGGATITSGQGTTTITVTFGNNTGDVCVSAINGCGSSADTCKPITVNPAPPQPVAITGLTDVCEGQPGVTYSISAVTGATSYTWTVPAGSTITSGQGTTSITVTFGSTSGDVCVTANNTCPSPEECTAITVTTPPATPGAISGPNSVCDGDAETYSISNVPGATSYTWTVPAGATITAGQGTNSIDVDWGPTSGNVCVFASNLCGTSDDTCIAVTVNPGAPSTPGTITGPDTACANQNGLTYSIAAVSGASSYNWTVPFGASVVSGQGTTSVTIDWGFGSGNVCVTASNGCGTSASSCNAVTTVFGTPAQPGAITGPASVCENQSGVTYSITAVNGATSYTWTLPTGAVITSGQGTTSVTVTFGTSSGNVCVTANNACGSSVPRCLTITINPVPAAPGTITGLNAVCPNQAGLIYSISAVTGATSYAWTVPSGASIVSGQGTTSVTVNWGTTAGNICVTAINACDTSTATCLNVNVVSGPPATPGAISGSDTVCANEAGVIYSITAVTDASGYLWTVPTGATITSGQGTTSITVTFGSTAGNVCVSAINGCGASADTCISVTVNPAPAQPGGITGLTTVCAGQSGVTYSITAVSGATSYTWTVPSGSVIISGQGTTSIVVTFGGSSGDVCVTANNPCSSTPSCAFITVNPLPPTPGAITGPNSVCDGDAETYSIAAVAGASSYTWTVPAGAIITGGQGTTSIDMDWGSTSGYVCVSASNSCGSSADTCLAVTVNPGAPPTPGAIAGPDTACSGQNGIVYSITAVPGATSYTWTVPFGASIVSGQGTTSVTVDWGFGSGNVCVTANNGCGNSGSSCNAVTTIFGPPAQPAAITGPASVCQGQSGVTYSITAVNGATSYNWTVPAGSTITSGQGTTSITVTFGNAPGNLCVSSVNACGSSAPRCMNVTVNPAPTVIVNPGLAAICTGDSITLTAAGAVTYAWSPSAGLSDTVGTSVKASPSSTTTYSVIGTSASGCTDTATATVVVSLSPSVSVSPAAPSICTGQSVTLNASGASTYAWTPAAGLSSTTGATVSASPTTTTTYTVTGTDSLGCTDTANVTVSVVPSLTVTVAPSAPSVCSGDSVSLTASGAATYIWSPSTGLSATSGETVTASPAVTTTYSVIGSSGTCADDTATVTVTVNPLPSVSTTSTNASCNGLCNGSATANASGGNSPYTYLWGDPSSQTSQTATGLCAGSFNVTVTDSNLCTATSSASVSEPSAINLTAAKTDVSCNGGSNGVIDLSVSGGVTPYSYSWSNGATTQDLNGLAAGTYTVTVTDGSSCQATASVTISQPTAITLSTTKSDVSCNGASTGSATVTPSGGTSPYSYLWNTGAGSATISGLAAGTYTVTVTDSKSCSASTSVTISQPSALALTGTKTNVSCNGGSNGSIDLSVTGGVTAYTYLWSNGATTQDLSGLSAGPYTVTVTDANGCTKTGSASITQPSALNLTTSKTEVSCNGGNNGTIDLSVSGGATAYSYSWSNGATTQDLTGLSAGTYTVTVTDGNSCTASASVTISQPPALSLSTAKTDVSCNGGNNGTIDLTVSGGTTSYSYFWSTGATTEDINGLTAGTYSVTVTDANSCTATTSVTINQINALSLSFTKTNVSCNGGSNGSIDLTVSGGTTAYSYQWSNGATSASLSGLSPGTYTVTVTDANSCTATTSATITQPSALNLSTTQTNVSCNGGSNGSINLSVSGGTTAYSYLWSNPNDTVGTTQDISGLSAGTYTVTVTDANSCTATTSATISQPASALSLTTTKTDVSCNGGNNGAIDLTLSGGSSPYSYSWNNGASTQDLTGLSAGTYTVTVADANSCTATTSVTISQPASLSLSTSKTDVSCNGGNNGSVNLTVTGGTTAYSYLWSNGATTEDISGLSAGAYTVTVTDANSCTAAASVTVNQSSSINLSVSKTNVSCNGTSTGSATVTVTGGTSPYTFLWSNGDSTNSIDSLAAGTYTVTVTDSSSCTATVSVSIAQPSALNLSTTKTDITCNGDGNGTIDLTVSGGTTAYSYSWSNGATTQDVSGLPQGTYTVTVTDAKTCNSTASVTISEPAALNLSTSATDVTCNGGNDGAIDLTVSGGNSPYTYLWSNSNGTVGSTQDISGLEADTFTVTVTDPNSCSASISDTVNQPAGMVITFTITNAACGSSDGEAMANVTGGATPYSYLWSNLQTTQTATGLPAGTYDLTVTGNDGCTDSATASISNTNGASVTVSSTNVNCFGGNNGTATASATGYIPVKYTINVNNFFFDSDTVNAIVGDTIEWVWVSGSHTTTSTAIPSGAASWDQPINSGSTSYTYKISKSGNYNYRCTPHEGMGMTGVLLVAEPYTYAWSTSPVQTDSSATGLTAGTYYVSVTDNSGCITVESATITEPTDLSLSAVITNATCNGDSSGAVNLSVNGGTPGYSYLWSNGSTTLIVTGLTAGTYSVTVADSNTCNDTMSVSVSQPAALSLNSTITNVSCSGDSTGAIDLTVTGGTTSYSYLWSTGATTQDIDSLSVGTYTVTVTDANSCVDSASFQVSQPSASVGLSINKTDVNCNGASTGSATVTANGGTSPYSYLWSNGSTTLTVTGLTAGTYSVTVTDSNSCTAAASTTISEPSSLSLSATQTGVSCNGGSNGSIDLTVGGGTSPYSYLWSNPNGTVGTTEDISGLTAGTYTVTVTDTNSCVTAASYQVSQASALNLTLSTTDAGCNGDSTGAIDLSVSGGTPAYSYNWTNGETTQDISAAAGTYTVTVTDVNSCTAVASATISQPPPLALSATATDVSCFSGADGSIDLSVNGGTPAYSYLWSNLATTQDINGLSAGTYSVTITDANSCTDTMSVTVSGPSALNLTASATDVSCNGASTGSATVAVNGGTSVYSYLWSNGSTTLTVTGLTAGTYTVTVTDANSCTATTSVTISQPSPGLTLSVSKTNISCSGGANGTIDLTVSGGTTGYSYSWSNGSLTEDLSNLSVGTYLVTITDSSGCTATTSVSISQPSALSLSAVKTDAGCTGGSNGSIDLSVSGGTTLYSYIWSNGATTEDINGLSPATYTVTVTDANNCSDSISVTINQPSSLSVSASGVDVKCNGGNDGEASATASGGTTPYSYLWSNGSAALTVTGLTAGAYSVTVTDVNNCTVTDSITVSEPVSAITLTTSATNATCFGGNDGEATVNASGGTTGYTYLWSDPNSTVGATASGLSSGGYTVTVTDANGCSETASTIVSSPPAIAITFAVTDASCGNADGSATASVSGGTGSTYSYLWSNSQTTQTASGLAAGVYNITVTDSLGCTATGTTSVNNAGAPTVSITSSADVSCNGGNNGSATVSASGGSAPYFYLWSDGQMDSTATGLQAGTYSVTVTDVNNCQSATTININEPSSLSLNTFSSNVSCNAACDGAAAVAPSGGTSPYTYLWSEGSTTSSITNICPGNYSVTITDANNCTTSSSFAITEPPAIGVTMISSNATCGNSDGSAAAAVTGGYSPYAYLWNNGSTTLTVSGLAAGTYSVTVTDSIGCTQTGTVAVSNDGGPTLLLTSTAVSCNGGNDGTSTVEASGAISPYSYLWSDGQSASTATGLSAGTMNVSVTDSTGCISIGSVVVSEPAALTLNITVNDVNCNSDSNGTATAAPSGGTPAYSYLWSDANAQTSQTATGLSAGNYSVTITDFNGCIISGTSTIGEPAGISISTASTNASCFGGNDGDAMAMPTGGISPYSYLWSDPGAQITQTATGLSAGAYNVTVADSAGCTSTASVTVGQPVAVTLTVNTADASCGSADGAAMATVSGGTAPYSYLWSNGLTGTIAAGLSAGIYGVTVTDANGCAVSKTVTVNNAGGPLVSASSTNVLCSGASTGSATANAFGGTSPYSYLWNDSAATATATVTGLPAGNYIVLVTDSIGCIGSASATISEPTPLVVTVSATDVSCGMNDGTATVIVGGGTIPYTYQWDASAGNQTSPTATGLSAGAYNVTVSDNNACFSVLAATVNSVSDLAGATSSTNVLCNGASTGSATVTATGGTTPYAYQWDASANNQTTPTASGLAAGTYNVTLTDSAGCALVLSATVTEPDSIALTITGTGVNCYGAATGTAAVTSSGGTAPYAYSWNSGDSTASVSGLASASYTVTVTDSSNCAATATVTISQPDSISIVVNSTDVNCPGSSDGTASASVSGGTPSYQYLWSDPNGQNTATATGLSAGGYTITVTDSLGCSKTASVSVGAGQGNITISPVVTNGTCNASNGQVMANVTGGSAPYSYLWSNGSTTLTVSGLTAGTYTVTVTDSLGCSGILDSIQVSNSGVPQVSAVVTNASCEGSADGAIDISATGNAPFSFSWQDNTNTEDRNNIASGIYVVTVTDNNGCAIIDSFDVQFGYDGCLNIPTVFTPNGDGINDNWNIRGKEPYPDMVVEVYNEWGSLVFESKGYSQPWDGNNKNGKPLPSAAYYYIISLGNGETLQGTITIVR